MVVMFKKWLTSSTLQPSIFKLAFIKEPKDKQKKEREVRDEE